MMINVLYWRPAYSKIGKKDEQGESFMNSIPNTGELVVKLKL